MSNPRNPLVDILTEWMADPSHWQPINKELLKIQNQHSLEVIKREFIAPEPRKTELAKAEFKRMFGVEVME